MKLKHKSVICIGLLLLLTSCSKSYDTPDSEFEESTKIISNSTQGDELDSNFDNATLVWSDEFDYTGLPDKDKWSFEIASPGWVNNELQYYTDSINNAEVKDGALTITLQKEKDDNGKDIYTSSRLVSREKGDWLYGKFEIRAKLPTGKGTWPAIWMMPTESAYGTWPQSGEIDILEYVGYDPGVIHGSVHSKDYYFKTGNQYTDRTSIQDEDDYHVYGLEWKPGSIEFFLDGQSYAKYEDGVSLSDGSKADLSRGWETFPFDKKFYMILNVAYGGDWGGAGGGVDDGILPKTMVVDYVRVYDYKFEDDLEAPTIPTDLASTRESSTTISLAWKPSLDNYGVSSYEVYNGLDQLIGTSQKNSFEIQDLEPDTRYSFKVRAIDVGGNKSDFSGLTEFSTKTYLPNVVGLDKDLEMIVASEYESMKGIDTEPTSDSTGGVNVGWIDDGDYMTYLIDVQEEGDYIFTARVASGHTEGGTLTLSIDDKMLSQMAITDSNGWQDWINMTDTIGLPKGQYVLKVAGSSFNLNWLSIGSKEYS